MDERGIFDRISEDGIAALSSIRRTFDLLQNAVRIENYPRKNAVIDVLFHVELFVKASNQREFHPCQRYQR